MFTRALLSVICVALVVVLVGCGEPNGGPCLHRESAIIVSEQEREGVCEKIDDARISMLRDNLDHLTDLIIAADSRSKKHEWRFPSVPVTDCQDYVLAYVERLSYVSDNVGETDLAFVFGRKILDAAKDLDDLSRWVRLKKENCGKCVAMKTGKIVASIHN